METFGDKTRGISGNGMTATDNGLHYDPYDFEIDKNPYPIWKRLRDERPLYHNEKYDFYALARFDDVESCSKDWRRYSSAKGTLLELIKGGVPIPRGSIIFEDPPEHDLRRALLTDVFTDWEVGWEHALQAHTSTVRGWERLPVMTRWIESARPTTLP